MSASERLSTTLRSVTDRVSIKRI